jgi:hypothetical protein
MNYRRSNPRIRLSRYFRVVLLIVIGGLLVIAAGVVPAVKRSSASVRPDVYRKTVNDSTIVSQDLSDPVWKFADETTSKSESQGIGRGIRAFRSIRLSRNAFHSIVDEAPLEFTPEANAKNSILSLPGADGMLSRFSIAESPIMAPELAARYPQIKTYSAQGIDDPAATARFDWTPTGFHGIVLSSKGTTLIEPASLSDVESYIVYSQGDVIVDSAECEVTTEDQEAAIARNVSLKQTADPRVSSGTALRTYRLAAATTAEYTQAYGGGTVAGGLAAVTTTINLVDAIYEREVAIRMILIANNDAIISTDTTTDGYTTDNVSSLIGENQTKLTSVIGAANYDVGHVFDGRLLSGGSFSWQGLGSFGVVCNNSTKARGVDIFRSLQPTNIYAYYSAAHELGHQFNATHTFNTTSGTCGGQRSSSTAYEPYNGSTIMAYRLACSPDDLASTDHYFHNASLEQIVNFTTGAGGSGCASLTATNNNAPTVDAGPSYTIPMGTPFTLTATGSDGDGDALTFGWEEFDLGAAAPPHTDDGARPIFRSFAPTASPARTFPRLADILNGFASPGETSPVTMRTMNFRVTARDNRSAGGGVNSAATQVFVRSDSGPFTVTQPASGATWSTGSSQTVMWNVANSNAAPVSCSNVRITLSTDGGFTFPIILANSTANDGSEVVTIPGTPSGNARVRVEAVGNIFFNISRGFTVTGSANAAPTITGFTPNSGAAGASVTIDGTNFISPTAVTFNGVNATFTVNSTTQIVATVPGGATTGPISVTTAAGTAVSANNFTVLGSGAASIQLSASSYSVNEGSEFLAITVTRTGDTSAPATVKYVTSDATDVNFNCNPSTAGQITGAASRKCDYHILSGRLRFAAGESSKPIILSVVNDVYVEPSESLTITLSNPTGATLGIQNTATINITDNDTAGQANPIDGTAFFVRMLYVDLLSREPDPAGFAGWVHRIDFCGQPGEPPPPCDRVTVGGDGFLRSGEFFDREFFVLRLYRVGLGRILIYPEVGDLAYVSGFLTAGDLELNKQELVAEIMSRPEFSGIYNSLGNAAFVDKLIQTAAVPIPMSVRDGWVSALNGSSKTRAQVYRELSERQEVSDRYLHEAQVVSCYYGFFTRNPDGAYLTYLDRLDRGEINLGDLANAFINAAEYKQRFGP